jgi:tetratricopeptide repeat protein 21B
MRAAFAAGMEGGIPEAVRELEALRVKRDAEFACIHALIVFHKRSSAVDSEVIESLAAAAPIAESMTSHAGLLLAARVLWHCGNFEESLRLIDGVLGPATVGPLQDEALLLKGWVELGLNPLSSEAARDLDRCNLVSDIDLAMARARCASARPNRRDMKSSAFEHLGQAIALAPTFWPALTEKALLLAEVGDWEQAMEVLERVFEMEGQADNLQALRIQSLEAFVRGDGAPNSVSLVEQLSESLRIHEGRNAHLHWLVSQPLSRVCGRQREILTRTLAMAERACELTHLPDQASVYLLELGLQRQRLGAHKSAMDAYLQAGQAEGGTVGAILGQVRCLIEEGALEDAEQQLEFLSVVQGDESLASSTGLPFLRALLRWRRDGDAAEHVSLLDESRAMHAAARQSASSLKSRSLYKVLTMADPDFMLELANEYLLHCDPSSKGKGRGSMNVAVQRGMSLLEATVALVPALLSARLLMAKVHLAMGQEDAASRVLDHCLELSPTFSEGHLLRAQIELGRGNADAAEASLELALSHNFKVRSSPLFHLIRARLLVRSGKLDEAATNLEDALRLPGVRDGAGSGESSPLGLSAHLADIFVEMIGVYSSLGRHAEAQELVAEAQARFRGQPSEVRMLIASSELALRKGELDRAVSILTAVPKNSPVYAEAQMARADIYLSHRHDKRAFAQCHRDLVRQDPTADGFMRLGDAYLRIQMPESAVEAYEGALDMNPTDPHIRSKIGRALIATHDYRRALEYHKKALRSAPGNLGLRLDLARLYLKLRRYEDAVMLLSQSIGDAGAEKGRRVDSVEAMKVGGS